MRKYIDCVRVTNSDLAYAIIQALEKDNNYSVDLYDNGVDLARRPGPDNRGELELRVYRNEKVIPPMMGFDAKIDTTEEGVCRDDAN